jgi:drug/metabolite transporter (DMT)-like permease
VPYGVVYWSERYVPSGLASILFATSLLLVALFAHLLLPGEPFRVRAGVGAFIAFAGVVIIFSEDLTKIAAAVLLLSLSAMPMAIGTIVMTGVAFTAKSRY